MFIADVSEFQPVIDWAAYGAVNPAVIVRAHNGWRADYKWPQYRDGSRQHCQWRGFYQYLPASVDPAAAAKAFAATVGPMLPGEVAILDLEEGTGDQGPRRQLWLDTLDAAVEWTYSGMYFARAHLPGVALDWIAAYQGTEPTDAHRLWQYTSAAQNVAGIGTCDGSTFHGTLQDLIALTQEADVALTDADVQKVVDAVLAALPKAVWSYPGQANVEGGSQTIWRTLVEGTLNTRALPIVKAAVANLPTTDEVAAAAKAGAGQALTVTNASVTLNVSPS